MAGVSWHRPSARRARTRSRPHRITDLALLAGLSLTVACWSEDSSLAYADAAAQPPAGAHADSTPAQPSIEQLLADFRRTVATSAPTAMAGERSKEALVRRFVRALEEADTNAFRDMAFTRAEFAYLYYPESPYTHRPYRQDPALLWFMIQEGSNKGLTRLMRRMGGHPVRFTSFRCTEGPDVHGETRLWAGCTIRRAVTPRDTLEQRLFGTIIERDGRFKFLSYANGL